MVQTPSKSISIYLESNPNPNSLKFVVNEMLIPEGMSFDFPNPETAKHAPLAQELFMYPFVDRVFYMSNFVTVTKQDSVDWIEVQSIIRDHMLRFQQKKKPIPSKRSRTYWKNIFVLRLNRMAVPSLFIPFKRELLRWFSRVPAAAAHLQPSH